MKKNRVLIVAERYAPYNGIPAVRPSKFTKYLCKNHNCIVDVIKMENDKEIVDDILAEDTKCVNKTIIISSVEDDKKAKQYNNLLLKKLLSVKILIDDYHKQCRKYRQAKKELSNVDLKQYDAIFTTYGPLFPHMVGKYVKKHNKNCIWIADYRDPSPVVIYSNRFVSAIAKAVIWKITQNADLITAVSPLGVSFLPNYKNKKSKILTNGFDSDDFNFSKRPANQKMILTYTGTIYPENQDLRPVFCCIKKLDNPSIEIHYAGRQFDEFYKQAKECGVENFVINHGLISRAESLKLQKKSDILLMCVWNKSNATDVLTGKVYEYMASEIPVICTVSGEIQQSLIKKIITNTQIGFCYEIEFDSRENLFNYISKQYNSFLTTGKTQYTPNKSEIENYEYKNITETLFSEIKKIRTNSEEK